MAVGIVAVFNGSYHSPGFDLTVSGLSGYSSLTILRIDTTGEYLDTPVRGADDVPISSDLFAVTDYEAPVGKSVVYQVVVTGYAANDNFSRILSGSWGTAPTGQLWTFSGGSASDYSVTGG